MRIMAKSLMGNIVAQASATEHVPILLTIFVQGQIAISSRHAWFTVQAVKGCSIAPVERQMLTSKHPDMQVFIEREDFTHCAYYAVSLQAARRAAEEAKQREVEEEAEEEAARKLRQAKKQQSPAGTIRSSIVR